MWHRLLGHTGADKVRDMIRRGVLPTISATVSKRSGDLTVYPSPFSTVTYTTLPFFTSKVSQLRLWV
jgi:hypothetical protein